MSSNEHTQWSVSQKDTESGWTGSQAFFTEADMLAHVRGLLAAGGCVQLSIDKYTPTACELREMDEAARVADNALCKESI